MLINWKTKYYKRCNFFPNLSVDIMQVQCNFNQKAKKKKVFV